MAEPSSTPTKYDLSQFGGSGGGADSTSVNFSKYAGTSASEKATLLSQNIHEDHHIISFDYTVLIAIFMVCATVIFITYLKYRKKDHQGGH